MSEDMSAYRDVFLAESAEYLDAISADLLRLETQPHDRAPVEAVFRGAHSLKGMAGAMGYPKTTAFTHLMESVMDPVRRREVTPDADLIDVMLQSVDAVRALIAEEAEGGPVADVAGQSVALEERLAAHVAATSAERSMSASHTALASAASDERPRVEVRVTLDETCSLKSVRAYLVLKRLNLLGTVESTDPQRDALDEERFQHEFRVIVRTELPPAEVASAVLGVAEVRSADAAPMAADGSTKLASTSTAETAPAIASFATAVPKDAGARRAASAARTVRVPIERLDALLDLVGELVILRSRLHRVAACVDVPVLREQLDVFASITGELRERVMETRAVPVASVFNRFPRLVRDLARRLDKHVSFTMSGLDVEVDRTVIDELADPLVHLLRNAVDHGIEPADERVAAGKPVDGAITLSAVGEAERVRIVVTDDGRGIDVGRVWEQACAAGLVDSRSRDAYSDSEVLWLTCLPGLSTAATATDISGRGVGMDVVKDRIEHLGGSLVMRSVPGEGTSLELVLPLTLAIIQSLLVRAGESTYVLPLAAVAEVLSPADVVERSVEGSPVVVVRDDVVAPLAHLDALLGLRGAAPRPLSPADRLVLLDVAGELRAVAVTRLLGRQEVVIKPLSPYFRDVRGLAGATVLGDGGIALILDPRSLGATGG